MKKECVAVIDALTVYLYMLFLIVYLYMLFLIIYLSAIETLICCREMSLIQGLLSSILHKIRYMIFKIPY